VESLTPSFIESKRVPSKVSKEAIMGTWVLKTLTTHPTNNNFEAFD